MPIEPPFSNFEHEIYATGMLAGRKPAGPLDRRELERDAAEAVGERDGSALTRRSRTATIDGDG